MKNNERHGEVIENINAFIARLDQLENNMRNNATDMRKEMNDMKADMNKNANERERTNAELQNLAARMSEIKEQFRNKNANNPMNSNNPIPPPLKIGRTENVSNPDGASENTEQCTSETQESIFNNNRNTTRRTPCFASRKHEVKTKFRDFRRRLALRVSI